MTISITFYNKTAEQLDYHLLDGTKVDITDLYELTEITSITFDCRFISLAKQVPINNFTLYDLLWCSIELDEPIRHGKDFIYYLFTALTYLKEHHANLVGSPSISNSIYSEFISLIEKCLSYSLQYKDSVVLFNKSEII